MEPKIPRTISRPSCEPMARAADLANEIISVSPADGLPAGEGGEVTMGVA